MEIANRSIVFLQLILFIALTGLAPGCSRAPATSATAPAPEQPDKSTRVSEPVVAPAADSRPATPEADPVRPGETGEDRLKHETRAVWSLAGRIAKSRADVDRLVAQMDRANLNVVLFLAYSRGTAYFEPSRTRFPDSRERLTNQSAFEDEDYSDALAYLLAIRDQRRLDADPTNDFEVHAWVTVAVGGRVENEWPRIDKTEPYMLNYIFPEFKLKYGVYYSENEERHVAHGTSVLQQPRFRAYMSDLLAGLVEDYHVDGIHLDYIRTRGICFNDEPLDYAGTEYDYPGCQEDYKMWTRETYGQEHTLWQDTNGFDQITDGGSGRVSAWMRRTVDMVVQSIHERVKAVDPDTIISVASIRNDTSGTSMDQMVNGQAAWEWLDRGWIDAVFVAAYGAETQSVIDRVQRVREAVQDETRRSRVWPGLGTYNTSSSGEFRSYLIVEQVNATMRGDWVGRPFDPPAAGMALFNADNLSEEAVQLLGEGPFKEPARPFWGGPGPASEAATP